MPIEPPPSPWTFPPPDTADSDGLVGVGADLEPGTVLAAYRAGLFPMPLRPRGPIAWWSPDPRGVIPLDGLRVSRSLRRALNRFEIRIDTAFTEVITACADPRRRGGWINTIIASAYIKLHRSGWAHSVEAWTPDGRLAGGLYGVAIGGLFAGESMFHRATDASKVALVALVDCLLDDSGSGGRGRGRERLLDVQWVTPHLATLGAVEIPAARYRERLALALELPLPAAFG
jgi:leucyl/phenylalanyl-tRNA---protein transferase